MQQGRQQGKQGTLWRGLDEACCCRLPLPHLQVLPPPPHPTPLQGPGMSEGSYPPAFPLKHQQKDLR